MISLGEISTGYTLSNFGECKFILMKAVNYEASHDRDRFSCEVCKFQVVEVVALDTTWN